MKSYVLRLDSGKEYKMTEEEKIRFQRKRGTTGRQYPIFSFDNGTEIAINKVEALEVSESDEFEEESPEVDNVVVDVESSEPVEELPKVEDGLQSNMSDEDTPELTKSQLAELSKKEAEALFLAKASCTHENVSLYCQNVTIRKKGEKDKLGARYFPVCDFCGHRGRYVAANKLTKEEMANAIEWIEK